MHNPSLNLRKGFAINPSPRGGGVERKQGKKTRFRPEPIASEGGGGDEKRGNAGQLNSLYRQME